MRDQRETCPYCSKSVKNADALMQHCKAKHKGRKKVDRREPQEESMADLLIDAEMNRAMGIPNEPWLDEMLP